MRVKVSGEVNNQDDLEALIKNIQAMDETVEILDLTAFNLENFSLQALRRVLANLPSTINDVLLDYSFDKYKSVLIRQVNPDAGDLVLVFEKQTHSESGEISRLFNKAEDLDESTAKITWVRESNQHAVLLVELLEEERHDVYKVHLRGDLVVRKPLNLLKGRFFWGTHYRDGRVEVKDLTDKAINIAEILTHWYVNKEDAQHLLAYARRKQQEKQYFNILGEGALSSMFMATVANQLSHSCVTWSREALLHAGINVPLSRLINFATITSLEAKAARNEPMDEIALARLARLGEYQTIQTYYPNNQQNPDIDNYVDPNTILHRATRGPSEFILGTYTPFMLACAYGHVQTVNTLLGEYGANPYVNSKSRFCFGLFGRYSAFDCAQSLLLRPYISKNIQQQTLEQLKAVDNKAMIIDALERYIETRSEKPEYQSTLSFFGNTLMQFGYSRDEKIEAACLFKEAVESGFTSIDIQFKGALNQGELGKLFKDYHKYSECEAITFISPDLNETTPFMSLGGKY
ncbi:ankyrin repeat domain-containing protein [Legionella spiritensis]|uniref:ankyrin repeat domain-containing protein n=1 Tax=Legionella spiritensis TaxID=452 RepID=UPI000F6FB257|nr:ankyrin repeat domain-containing protein [Legionella spiritensis]VEG89908.1 Uncharacterised protein [Legionella spiritensis]